MLSPTSIDLLQYYPNANRAGTANNLQTPIANEEKIDQFLGRLDHNIGNKVRLSLRYNWHKSNVTNPLNAAIPVTVVTQPRVNKNWLLGYTHTLNPNLYNDFRIGYHQINFDTLNPFSVGGDTDAGSSLGIPGFDGDVKYNNPGIPSVNIGNFNGIGAGGTNWYQFDKTFQVSDVLSYVRGNHNIRAGFDLRRLETGRQAANDARGLFNFTGDITGYSVADFMLGLPRTVIPPTDQIQGDVGGWRNGFFINDVWQATRNLTLSLGLRYELNTPVQTYAGLASMLAEDFETIIPSSFPAEGFKFHEPNHSDFAPRLGATYRLGEKTVLRARVRHLLQPEPDELVHVPDQQPSDRRRHHVHLGPEQSDALVRPPVRRRRPCGAARHDLADAPPAERPQGPVELRHPARARRGTWRSTSSTSARTPATWIAASSTTRRSRAPARSIRVGPARSSGAAASSRTT